MGDEVFSFRLSLFPGATEGQGYSDMSKVDGKVTLRLGCIQIVYLHKFLMSLLVSTHTQTHLFTNSSSFLFVYLNVLCISCLSMFMFLYGSDGVLFFLPAAFCC